MQDDTQLGPLSSKEQFETISEQVRDSVKNGATVLCGGDPDDRTGQYYPATVLADCKPGMPAYDDEWPCIAKWIMGGGQWRSRRSRLSFLHIY